MNSCGPIDLLGAEHVTADPGTELFKGRLIFNTTSNEFKVYDGVSWVSLTLGSGSSTWTKYVVTYSDFSDPEVSKNDIELLSLPAASVIEGINIKHTVRFEGGGAGSVTISVGLSPANFEEFASDFDVHQVPGPAAFQSSGVFDYVSGSTTSIRVCLTADVPIEDLTGGSCNIWVKAATLPA